MLWTSRVLQLSRAAIPTLCHVHPGTVFALSMVVQVCLLSSVNRAPPLSLSFFTPYRPTYDVKVFCWSTLMTRRSTLKATSSGEKQQPAGVSSLTL